MSSSKQAPLLIPSSLYTTIFLCLNWINVVSAFSTNQHYPTDQTFNTRSKLQQQRHNPLQPYTDAFVTPSSSHLSTKISSSSLYSSSVSNLPKTIKSILSSPAAPYTREEASQIITNQLYPQTEYAFRTQKGRDAQNIKPREAVSPSDPRMALTYGEFPLESFDALVDVAIQEFERGRNQEGGKRRMRKRSLVDLGSGCGRLVLYAALTRGSSGNDSDDDDDDEKCYYDVHGIEIGDILHEVAVSSLERGIDAGYFLPASNDSDDNENDDDTFPTTVQLHLGAAIEYSSTILANADIIFAYSTVWPCLEEFNTELSAMIVGPEWSEMLSKSCQDGVVVVTTDRALDPGYGWELISRMDVENPDLFGSTGYVQVLRKQ